MQTSLLPTLLCKETFAGHKLSSIRNMDIEATIKLTGTI